MAVTSSIHLDHWFSTRSGFASQGTVSTIWRDFWLSQLGGWYCHLEDRSQECCSTFYNTQDRPSEAKNYSAQGVQNANVGKTLIQITLHICILKVHCQSIDKLVIWNNMYSFYNCHHSYYDNIREYIWNYHMCTSFLKIIWSKKISCVWKTGKYPEWAQ